MKLKETYAHTKTQWETEIRRLRKENNKLTSETIKYREELKEHRAELRKAKATISEEKERTDEREKEAFTARYQLEGLQQQLTEAMEKIKLVEQERDSFKTLAKSEEVARIAAEGQIPMPSSPKKEVARPELEVPMPIMSMADEQDVEHLKLSLDWERARANRAYDLVDFMKLECRFNSCACCLRAPSTSNKAKNATNVASNSTTRVKNPEDALEFEHPGRESVLQSTVFIASEGIFRTVASPSKEGRQEQADERQSRTRSPEHRKNMSQTRFPVVPSPSSMGPPRHSRTPSCDPPNYRNSVVSNDASGMFADEPAVNLGNGRAVMDRKENIVCKSVSV